LRVKNYDSAFQFTEIIIHNTVDSFYPDKVKKMFLMTSQLRQNYVVMW